MKILYFYVCLILFVCVYSKEITTNEVIKKESIIQPQQFIGMQNPTYGFCEIDYLFWKAKRTGYFYHNSAEPQKNGNIFLGEVHPPKSHYSSGFKVDMGLSNLYDWMIEGDFTFYKNGMIDNNIDNKSPSIFYEGNLIQLPTQTISSQFHLNYWTSDLLLSNRYAFTNTFYAKPFIACKACQLYYRLNIHLDLPQLETLTIYPGEANFKIPYKFLGFGPFIGLKAFYEFNSSGVTLFGSAASSLLYGKVKVKYNFHFNYDWENGIDDHKVNFHIRFDDLKAHLQLQLGSFWKYSFSNQTKAFILGMNWEANYFWDLYNYRIPTIPLATEEVFSPPPPLPTIPETEQSLILLGLDAFIALEF